MKLPIIGDSSGFYHPQCAEYSLDLGISVYRFDGKYGVGERKKLGLAFFLFFSCVLIEEGVLLHIAPQYASPVARAADGYYLTTS